MLTQESLSSVLERKLPDPRQPISSTGKMKRVVIIEDQTAIREMLAELLRNDPNFKIVGECGDGQQAYNLCLEAKPDLIILDVTMPVMDGVTMLTRLKEDPALKAIPVIMLTAESGRENVLQIAKLGVRDYLVKPFKEEQLIEKAARCVTLEKRPVAATPTPA